MWEFNYGEWTEAYVFLRLLESGRIYGADSNFQKDENVYMDIISILRHERDHILEFERMLEEAKIKASDNGEVFKVLTYTEVFAKASYLYDTIRNITSSDRKFSIPEIEDYLTELKFSQPKAPAMQKDIADKYGAKSDIVIKVRDSIDHIVSTLGFSIKSHLGQASTLFNSAKSSNLKFKVIGCNDDIMAQINCDEIDSEQGIFAFIKKSDGLSLEFQCTSQQFTDNLDLVDCRMPEVFANIMLIQLGYMGKPQSRQTADLVARLAELNPLNVRRPEVWYESKIKQFLFDSFAGLT
ncbi:MAG: HpaII family restriction endonuclease, partial [Pseudobutyrivibrio sp.]|nr:HpaII family restriction endonuclease [Pseudobutyrivibrio sp.]